MMLLHTDGKPLKTHLRALSVLVSLLLLTHHCRGQSQLIGSYQPIVANLGGDIILPCYLVPAINVADLTLEWTRPDMDPRFVHVIRLRHELADKKHKLFKGRTSMFTDELKNGNISLKLSNVQLSDQGKYRCFIPELDRQAFVQLVCVSAAAHPPVVTLSGLDGQSGGVVLQCESAGWYPEPEVLWLDAEGKLLSAGPPETVRGPDDLYTVSSRVTVEKRPSSSFTCRVQHHNTTRTTQTQTQIHFPDDFFKLQSRSSSHIIGLAVSLAVCILLMLATFFFLWREHIFKTKRKHSNEDQSLNEGEKGELLKTDPVQMEALKGNVGKKSKPKNQSEQQLLEEQRRREEAEKEVQTLKEQLQNKKKEVESKQSELQGLHAEKQRNEKELQSLKGDLENKNRELEIVQKDLLASKDNKDLRVEKLQKKKDKVEQEVENLQKKLEAQQEKTDTKTKEVEVKEAEVQQLQEEGQRMETSLQTLMEEVELKRPLVSRQKFEEEKQRREEAEKKVHILEEKLRREEAERKVHILEEKLRREEAEKKVHILEEKLQKKTDALLGDIQNLKDEKQKSEDMLKELEAMRKEDKEHADTKKTDEELMNAQGQLKSKEEEISQLKIELEKKLHEEKSRREEAEKELKYLKEEVESKLLNEKLREEEAERSTRELVDKNSKFQEGNCEGSDNSGSVEPPLTPPNAQTSDPGFNIEVDQQRTYIRLRNTSTKDKQLGSWKLDLQVNNNESITRTFPLSFNLKAGRDFTMWVKGHGRKHTNTDLVWRDLKSLSSGDKLQVVLFNQKQEIQYELCVTIP